MKLEVQPVLHGGGTRLEREHRRSFRSIRYLNAILANENSEMRWETLRR